ncbi:hypothetical protein C0991_009712 [Blastosporella zonata]|nr:hypothetical protein C0991_009712 [Blastosporella zonata]
MSYAPGRLKKELDSVLTLHGNIDAWEKTLQASILALSESPSSLDILNGLRDHQEHTKDRIEDLYASLNVEESFPDLEGVDFDFLRKLLVARDLKINIRRRAIGSFFEWDKLDQASGGHQALGGQGNLLCLYTDAF